MSHFPVLAVALWAAFLVTLGPASGDGSVARRRDALGPWVTRGPCDPQVCGEAGRTVGSLRVEGFALGSASVPAPAVDRLIQYGREHGASRAKGAGKRTIRAWGSSDATPFRRGSSLRGDRLPWCEMDPGFDANRQLGRQRACDCVKVFLKGAEVPPERVRLVFEQPSVSSRRFSAADRACAVTVQSGGYVAGR